MTPTELLRELLLPMTRASTLVAFVLFFLVLQVLLALLTLGVQMPLVFVPTITALVFVTPSLFVYLTRLLEARAEGKDLPVPGSDELVWFNDRWALAQLLFLAALGYAAFKASDVLPGGWLIPMTLLAALLPASLCVLAITHSLWQSVRPSAIIALIERCGQPLRGARGLVPVHRICHAVAADEQPLWRFIVALYGLFAFYTVCGAILRPKDLMADIEIETSDEYANEKASAAVIKTRNRYLNHAYALISRDNRAGGFKHIDDLVDAGDDPMLWVWFFQQMMRWENREPAVAYARKHLGPTLQAGEFLIATKVLLRCRLEIPDALPLPEDRALALQAAEHCQHEELAEALRRSLPQI